MSNMPTQEQRIAELEQEVNHLKGKIHHAYPEPDFDGQGGRPSWVVNRELANEQHPASQASGY